MDAVALAAAKADTTRRAVLNGNGWGLTELAPDGSQNPICTAQAPQSVYNATAKKTFLGYTGPMRDFYVVEYDHTTRVASRPLKVASATVPRDDDHSPPTLLVDRDGYLHFICGNHSGYFLQSRSVLPNTISGGMSTARTMNEIPQGTYQSTCYDSATDTIWSIYRSGISHANAQPGHESGALVKSTDKGATFSLVGYVVDTRTFDSQTAHDAYVVGGIGMGSNGRVHFTWFVARGLAHDGMRRNLYHAYFDPATGHVFSMGGTDLGTAVTGAAGHASCLVTAADWIPAPKQLVGSDDSVLILFSAPIDNGTTTPSTLGAAASAGDATISLPSTAVPVSRIVLNPGGGNQEQVWALKPRTPGSSTITVGDGIAIPGLANAHANGETATVYPQVIAVQCARWTGSSWVVADTGARTNHAFNTGAMRRLSDGTLEAVLPDGGSAAGRTIWIQPGSETLVYAGLGDELVRFTSPTGATWTRGQTVARFGDITGNGIACVQRVLNGSDDLPFIAAGASTNGASTWKLPVYGVSPKLQDAKRAQKRAIEVRFAVRTGFNVLPSPGVTTTFDCTDMVPERTAAILLRVSGAGDGTAGQVTWTFIEYNSNRTIDAELIWDRAITWSQRALLWVPLSPDKKFTLNLSAGITSPSFLIQPMAARVD